MSINWLIFFKKWQIHSTGYYLIITRNEVVGHNNPSMGHQEPEAEGLQVQNQPEQLSETLSQNKKNRGLEMWFGSRTLAYCVPRPGHNPQYCKSKTKTILYSATISIDKTPSKGFPSH